MAEAAELELSSPTSQRRGLQENLAIALLLFGGVFLVAGWFVGVVLLWTSNLWTTRDKVIGSLLLPGGLLPVLVLVAFPTSGSSTQSCSSSSNGPTICTSTSTHSGLPLLLVLSLVMIGIAVPIATAIYLNSRLNRRPG
jgi:hypothetical protein